MSTITYSIWTKGWTSFWSYVPDWMIGLNSSFYTFSGGDLYRHNDDTVTRNNFYGAQYKSTITTVFNDEPMQMKMFKTLSQDSNKPWKAIIDTDINTAQIDATYFNQKEDEWFAYIRRVDDTIDLKAISTQGIGNSTTVASSDPTAVLITFAFNMDGAISVGNRLYKNNAGSLVLIGVITAIGANTITVNTTEDPFTTPPTPISGSIPLISDFLIAVKNSQAESYGSRGFYMSVKLENEDTTQVELFSVGSSIFKSFP